MNITRTLLLPSVLISIGIFGFYFYRHILFDTNFWWRNVDISSNKLNSSLDNSTFSEVFILHFCFLILFLDFL